MTTNLVHNEPFLCWRCYYLESNRKGNGFMSFVIHAAQLVVSHMRSPSAVSTFIRNRLHPCQTQLRILESPLFERNAGAWEVGFESSRDSRRTDRSFVSSENCGFCLSNLQEIPPSCGYLNFFMKCYYGLDQIYLYWYTGKPRPLQWIYIKRGREEGSTPETEIQNDYGTLFFSKFKIWRLREVHQRHKCVW